MKRHVLILLVTLAGAAHASERPDPPAKLSLTQAVDAGIRGATLVLKNQNNTVITGADLLKAYGNFMPNLQLNGQFGVANGSTLQTASVQSNGSSGGPSGGLGVQTGNYQGASYSISSSLNLFNGFGDVASYNAAHERNQASHLTLDRARQQIALDITQSFLQSVLDLELTDIAQKNLNASRDRLKLLQAQHDVGSANSADVYRQATVAAADEANWIVARNRAQVSQLQLLQRLRLNARKNYELEKPALHLTASAKPLTAENDLIDHALGARHDLDAQRDSTSAARSDVSYARRTYFPTLDLVGTLGAGGRYYFANSIDGQANVPPSQLPLYNQLGTYTTTLLALNLNYEIFDRFTTTDATRRAEASRDDAEIDLDDMTNEVIAEVREGYADYQAAVAQLQASDTGLQAATKAYQLITGRYKVGASSFIDLTTSQAELAGAEARHAQAVINLKLREEALNYVTGEDPTDLPR